MNAYQAREVSNEHDVAIIAAILASEAGDQRDRQYAQALERQLNEEPDGQDDMSDDEMNLDNEADEDLRDMLGGLSDGLSDFEPEEETEQQDHQLIAPEDPATQPSPHPGTKECDVCKEAFPIMTTLRLPCSHHYCHPCLIEHLEASVKTEFLFPPVCCGEEISIKASERFLPDNLVQQYHEKMIEHKTKDRTYCSNVRCLKFIPPNDLSESGEACYKDEEQCSSCFEITCAKCKSKAHNGACEQQVARDQVLDLAEREGWKQCGRCGHLIELNLGCFHMECSCGHQFCYLCSREWKTCQCPQFEENRLVPQQNRPDVIVALPRLRRPPPPPLELHEDFAWVPDYPMCTHNLRRVQGPGRCNMCLHRMRWFTFRCADCGERLCNDCRIEHLHEMNEMNG